MTPPQLQQRRPPKSSLTLSDIHVPPNNLQAFCEHFDVERAQHRDWFINGVRIWPSVTHLHRPKRNTNDALTTNMIDSLSRAGILRRVKRSPFTFDTFMISKQDGRARFIINFKPLTPYLRAPPFCLPSIYQILQTKAPILHPSKPLHFVKIDIANAFYNIPINKASQFVTTIKHSGKYYAFTKLPFGISIAPLICQVFTVYIVRLLRKLGVSAWGHIDVIACDIDVDKLRSVVHEVVRRLELSGIKINQNKSILEPAASITFLGAIWEPNRIRRLPEITKLMIHLIDYVQKPHTWKKARSIAGLLLYYLEFAGRNHLLTTFYLRNYNNMSAHPYWKECMLMNIAIDEIRLRPPRTMPKNVHFLFCDATQTTSAYTVNDDLIRYHEWERALPIHHAELYAFLACLEYAYSLCEESPDDEVAIATDNQLVLAMYTT
jgi:hypothetical protein